LPDEDDFGDIEASERCFIDKSGALQLRSTSCSTRDQPHIVHVAFVRKTTSSSACTRKICRIQADAAPAGAAGSLADWRDLLLDVYDTDVEYFRDSLKRSTRSSRKSGNGCSTRR